MSDKSRKTTVKRLPKRGRYDRETIDAVLDQGLVCHVGFAVDGQPYVLPMSYARDGGKLLLHGSVGSRLIQSLAGGVEACVTVTLLDGLVLARSQFHHSMNYRSVVAFGTARVVSNIEKKRQALERLVEQLIPGRAADSRPPSDEELRATTVLEFPLSEASAKVRVGPPGDARGDLELSQWAGVIPLETTAGKPDPAPDLSPGIEVPDYALRYRRPGGTAESR
jgi:nitroimidazol reductase NimA-like FMN-containing flavoprotein (pyridoxamine 5'-phosphate oxidase superfamily)